MQSSSLFSYSQCHPRRGVALVIVLAFLVLLSGLVIAFFVRVVTERQVSNSNLSDTKSDILARSALDVIVGDLKQEIVLGSDIATVNGISIYQPKSAANMLPTRSGAPPIVSGSNPIPNLVRRSMVNATGIPGLTGVASNLSSSGTSANNRSIKLARWNAHYLIPRSDTSDTIDFTPISGASGFTPPDWVMVTANGPAVITSPTNSVIGRYAYAIYNEGALLDVNVAGYPSKLPAGDMPHPSPNPLSLLEWGYARKGGVAFADLTQLPTITSGTLSQTLVDRLVGWRNYASAQPGGTFKGGYTFDDPAAARYFDTVVSATNGFLSVATPSSSPSSGQTDQVFTSRQAFLKFSRDAGISQNVLQYLGTFSREKNAPSWSPLLNASDLGGQNNGVNITSGAVITDEYAYYKKADAADAFNRRIANVRVTDSFDRVDGSTAVVGEPLVKQRFDLNRLSWIRYDGTLPSGVTAADVMNYFGLTRESSGAWIYNHGAPGNGARINTLEEVAAQKREPDFFELLQAGILKGSMGLVSGDPAFSGDVAKGGEFYRAGGPLRVPSGNNGSNVVRTDVDGKVVAAQEKYQVMQIGASIIDQFDEDDYPTEVVLNGQPFTGVENLPYINAMATTVLRPVLGVTTGDGGTLLQDEWQTRVHQWLTFSLWNPHRNAKVAAAKRPTIFRIAAVDGMVAPRLQNLATADQKIQQFTRSTPSWIRFNIGDYNGFSEPTALNYAFSETSNPNGRFETPSKFSRAGIYLGSSSAVDCKEKVPLSAPLGNTIAPYFNTAKRDLSPPPTFELQYLREGGNANSESDWRTYQIISSFVHGQDTAGDPYFEPADPGWIQNASTWNSSVASQYTRLTVDQDNCIYAILDPRSLRFNVTRWQGNNPNNLKLALSAINGKSPSGPTVGPWYTGVTDFAYTVNNTAGNRYTDRDFVPRVGDLAGWYTAAADNPLTAGSLANRNVMLNRPFRSVGELGFVFRDTPWRTLNLISANSADSALLDLFCVGAAGNGALPPPSVVAGKVDINGASIPVLKALIANALRDYQPNADQTLTTAGTANVVSASDSQLIAADIATKIRTTPLVNLANIPGLFPQDASKDNNMYPGVKWKREALVRALADSSSTRTWNLLIDVIAQSGRYAPNAGTDLNKFTVEGEKHYWFHVAIDRFTGEVIDQQLELVRE